MAMHVFNTAGEAVGFVYETFIHDREGTPLGRILGSRVHRMDGTYAGEWFHNMVVAKRASDPRAIGPLRIPAAQPPMRDVVHRRPAAEHFRYPDAFARLYEMELTAVAAE